MFVVKCPRCDKRSKAFVDQAGLKGKCPHCSRKITIVSEAGETPQEAYPVIAAQPKAIAHGRHDRLPDTSPPALPLGAAALVLTWLVYLAGNWWFAGTPAWDILLSCRWVGNMEVCMFIWALLIIGWKAYLWRVQQRPLGLEVFPRQFAKQAIRPSDVDSCLAHVQGLARKPSRYILLHRIWLALDHLRLTRSVQEVRGALTGQSAIDANLLDSSYSMLRFLIWVIPILGFIGTVVGIGIAVTNFSGFIPKVSEVEKAMDSIRTGLGQVTTGLATAFNTTLVALCFVAPLMLLTSWLRKAEEHLLARFDQFSNHDLIGKLADSREPEPVAQAAEVNKV